MPLRKLSGVSVFVFLLVSTATTAFAQQTHIVKPEAIAGAVSQQVDEQGAKRQLIHDTLARPEVAQVAAKAGLDLKRANAIVDTLSNAHLDQAAATAQQVNDSLIGGASTIVISTTAIIIILLIVLIIAVA